MTTTCLIAFGANLGNPHDAWDRARAALRSLTGLEVTAVSSPHTTPPIGGPAGQQVFINAVVRAETVLPPFALLAALRELEIRLGRSPVRTRWGPRVADLDLLLYGGLRIRTPDLEVPHPRMSFRRFVIEPAVEVAAELQHPEMGMNIGEMLEHLDTSDNYVALVGPPAADVSGLVEEVSRRGGHLALHAAATTADPLPAPGHGLDAAIEFLRTQSQRLAEARTHVPDGAYLVSDFWCFQSLVQCGYRVAANARRRLEVEGAKLIAGIPQPKLLILVPPPGSAQPVPWFEAVVRQLRAAPCGPRFRLSVDDREWAANEVLAALQAMEPVPRG